MIENVMRPARRTKRLRLILRPLCAIAWVLAAGAAIELRPPSPASSVLDLRVQELNFDHVDRAAAVEMLRRRTGTRVNVDWAAMEDLGVARDAPIDLHLQSASLGAALRAIFPRSPGDENVLFELDRGSVRIIGEADKPPVACVYYIADLVDSDYANRRGDPPRSACISGQDVMIGPPSRKDCAADLANIVANFVLPEVWGWGMPPERLLDVTEKYMIVVAESSKQKKIAAFMTDLHKALARHALTQ